MADFDMFKVRRTSISDRIGCNIRQTWLRIGIVGELLCSGPELVLVCY